MRLAEFLAALANAPDDAIFDFETSIAPDVDALLGAIRVSPRRIADFTEHPEFLHLLRDQLAGKEEKLKGNLERVNWEIDSKATLLAVAGTGPLETVRIHQSNPCRCTAGVLRSGAPFVVPSTHFIYSDFTLCATRGGNLDKSDAKGDFRSQRYPRSGSLCCG